MRKMNPGNATTLECMECGKIFKRVIGPKTVEIVCPKCHGVDVEPVGAPPYSNPKRSTMEVKFRRVKPDELQAIVIDKNGNKWIWTREIIKRLAEYQGSMGMLGGTHKTTAYDIYGYGTVPRNVKYDERTKEHILEQFEKNKDDFVEFYSLSSRRGKFRRGHRNPGAAWHNQMYEDWKSENKVARTDRAKQISSSNAHAHWFSRERSKDMGIPNPKGLKSQDSTSKHFGKFMPLVAIAGIVGLVWWLNRNK
jgi:hypothetical protein